MVLENQCPAKGKLVLNSAVIFRQPHHHIINYCVKKKIAVHDENGYNHGAESEHV